MLTASCPSCASPVVFASGAALTAVCPACSSCVVRDGDLVRDFGKIARFQRDLSPIQVGARGNLDGRAFTVSGVLRKGRERVRWNEWYITFEDGGDGWIGEGNGGWFAFGRRVDAVRVERNRDQVSIEGTTWVVMEDGEAEVKAAEGQLPFALAPSERRRYLDLREATGAAVATLDYADDPPSLWIGRDVTLVSLQMTGLRPFTGWSDPVLVNFAGPEISGVRSLKCPNCGGSLELHSPGKVERIVCPYCGSTAGIRADREFAVADLVQKAEAAAWKPELAVGSRGKLRGVDWAIIGAMSRGVYASGSDWRWTEYLLFNPYRGFAWLVCDTLAHWSFVEPLRGALPRTQTPNVVWRNQAFVQFQSGTAGVRAAIGEFTWEVSVGETAETTDFVSPPLMLSVERTPGETVWSVGTWIPADEVSSGFGTRVATPRSVAAHQPNPYKTPERIRSAWIRGGALALIAAVLFLASVILPANEVVQEGDYLIVAGENAWVTAPFTLAEPATVDVALSDTTSSNPDVMVSLVETQTGEVWDWTGYGNSSANAKLSAGTWTARIALGTTAAAEDVGKTVGLRLTRDPMWLAPSVLLLLYSLAAPLAFLMDQNGFERRRWENA